jgi:hypothetical protein
VALNLGGIIRLTYTVKNEFGAATNPSSATLTITQPDGTIAAGTTITLPPSTVGQLVYDFTPTQVGRHDVDWATTVPTTSEDDVFYVEQPGRLLISVDDAVEHLNATGVLTGDVNRERLQNLCLAASDAVERDLDRILARRAVVETYDGGSSVIILRSSPVLSVTSVTVGGVATTSYTLNTRTGLLYSNYGMFTSGYQNVVVSYVAGYPNPPYAARMVALNLVQAMWQQSQTAFHPALDESAELNVSTAVAGLPDPLRRAYDSLRLAGVA